MGKEFESIKNSITSVSRKEIEHYVRHLESIRKQKEKDKAGVINDSKRM
ncbi:hypothetical protein QUF79_14555 [Fictibacillus enclensis]|nr:hypothetical protein [Fictibacillus enclensis]MDM5199239.1 hypothetical protein [Fictibacillus enclensis]